MANRFGNFTLHEIRDGTFSLDGGAMFGIVPKPLWQKRHPADERNRVQLGLRCLLIEAGGRRVLVDSGIGSKWDDKHRDIYAIDQSHHGLDRDLLRAGCAHPFLMDGAPSSSCDAAGDGWRWEKRALAVHFRVG